MDEKDLAAIRTLAQSPLVRMPVRTIASAVVLASIVSGLLFWAAVYLQRQAMEVERWNRGEVSWEELRDIPVPNSGRR